MLDDESFEPLEERLVDEARQFLADSPPLPPVAALRAEFVRRRRQRISLQVVCGAAALIAVGVMLTGGRLRPGSDVAPAMTGAGQPAPAVAVSPGAPSAEVAADARETIVATESESFAAIAILIPQQGDDGELELVPAWYVPGQIEEIDIRTLSPAERSAVSQLLGPDYDFSSDNTI